MLGWRLVNFWLPIPAGAIAYASLKVPRGAGFKAMRAAVLSMMTHASASPGPAPPEAASPDHPPPEAAPTQTAPPEGGEPPDSPSDR